VEEPLPVACHPLPVVRFPPLSPEQALALQTASEYLNHAETQVTSVHFGVPQLTGDTAILAEFITLMLCSAALCDGLLELADTMDRQ
jgi:hypothetical protein